MQTCYLSNVLSKLKDVHNIGPKFYTPLFPDTNYIAKIEIDKGTSTYHRYDIDTSDFETNLPLESTLNLNTVQINPLGDYDTYEITGVEVFDTEYRPKLKLTFKTKTLLVNHSESSDIAEEERDDINLRVCYGSEFYVIFNIERNAGVDSVYFKGLYRTSSMQKIDGFAIDSDRLSYGDLGYHHISNSACLGTWGQSLSDLTLNSEAIPLTVFMNTLVNFLVHRNHDDSAGRGGGDTLYVSSRRSDPSVATRIKLLEIAEQALDPFNNQFKIYAWGRITQKELIKICQKYVASSKGRY